MILNTAGQKVGAQMVSATDGSAFTGSVTVAVTIDAGVQATGSVGSGACTHEGNGYHTYAPAQAETNGALIAFTFTGTGAIPVTVQVYTVAGDAFTRLGTPVGASVSADIAAVQADTDDIQTRLPAALVGGRIDANVGAISADAVAADNLEAALDGTGGVTISAAVTGNITGNLSGSVGSVTGAVGSVTGNVGGNVAGSVGSVAAGGIAAASFAAGAIDAAAIAANAIGASELAADAVDEILDETIGDSTVTMRQALKLLVAVLGGKLAGAATTTVTIRNAADTTDVVTATVDANGNRTAVTLSL